MSMRTGDISYISQEHFHQFIFRAFQTDTKKCQKPGLGSLVNEDVQKENYRGWSSELAFSTVNLPTWGDVTGLLARALDL